LCELPDAEAIRRLMSKNLRKDAVVVSPDLFRRWEQRGDRLFALMDRVGHRNLGVAGDAIESDVERAIAEVRTGEP